MMRRRIQVIIFAIVALVIVALSVMGIQRFRESARQTECRQRMGNLAQSVRRYAETNKRIPPGYLGPNPDCIEMKPAPYVGTLVYLLPHLVSEGDGAWQKPYFQTAFDGKTDNSTSLVPPANVPWWELTNPTTRISNRQLARRQFSFLLCPSVNEEPITEGMIVALHSYGDKGYFDGFLQRKIITINDDSDVRNWGRTHYLPVAGTYGEHDSFAGMFTNRSGENVGVGRLVTSRCVIFGEALGGCTLDPSSRQFTRQTAYAWFCGPLPTYYGLPETNSRPWNAFNGPHPKGVMFAWTDGGAGIIPRSFDEDEKHVHGWDDNPPKKFETLIMKKGRTTDIGSHAWNYLQACASRSHGLDFIYPVNVLD